MDPIWYKNVVFYALDISRFADSNGDGWGDFAGATQKVSYLADLGVSAIWLLPCFPSPRRDNGYDISDYERIDPRLGTLEDFLQFIHRCGEHGIRVLTDLVMNHTSRDHPWFQAARFDEKSRYRNYYVWSDSPPPLSPGLTPVFPGQEDSVWTYDPLVRAYYFHRFYTEEPGLNLSNPQVQEEVRRIMDLWLSYGIAGFRIDAAAHMVAEKGLNATRMKDPHDLLRGIHDYARERRPDVVMLGEVDLPPDPTGSFFGSGDEMNMLFNFLLCNHLWLALADQSVDPIHRAMGLVPKPPASCQWANFLRNLDELDLEQMPAADRLRVMDAFAPEEDMRIFGRGIRRRTAPMLGDAGRVKMAWSLLFSLPGTPCLTYGDEIGMGEDPGQPGRDAVRAPMQWNDSPGAGFSRASPDRLIQPVIDTGPFGCRQVNVRRQQDDPDSLLAHIRQLAALRRTLPEIGDGSTNPLETGDKAVLGHSYGLPGGMLFLLHNLSADPKQAALRFGPNDIGRLVDLFDGESRIAEPGDHTVSLGPYGFRWLKLER